MVNTRRSAKQFARGHRGGILTTAIPASFSTVSNEAANCPDPVGDSAAVTPPRMGGDELRTIF
jgi:hypothetical protein